MSAYSWDNDVIIGHFYMRMKVDAGLELTYVASTCTRLHAKKAVLLRPLESKTGGCISGLADLKYAVH